MSHLIEFVLHLKRTFTAGFLDNGTTMSTAQALPVVLAALDRALAVVGIACAGSQVPRVLSISAAEQSSEYRAQWGQTAGNDANVALDDGPDGDVARVPQPVAKLSIVDQEAQLDQAGRTAKDAKGENSQQCIACALVDVEVSEHHAWEDDSEEDIGNDVQGEVGVRERLESVRGPAGAVYTVVP